MMCDDDDGTCIAICYPNLLFCGEVLDMTVMMMILLMVMMIVVIIYTYIFGFVG